jgi:uncharacterized protein (TIRG00374 family)
VIVGSPSRDPRRGTVRLRLVGLAISVAALALVLQSVDLGKSVDQISRANLTYLAACLAVIATQVVLRSLRWRLLLPRRRDGGPIPLRRVPAPLLVAYLGNAVLPARLGEPIRAYLVARREDVDAVECFGSVVLERIVDTATLAVVAFVAAAEVGAPDWLVRATALVAFGGVVLVAGIVLVGLKRFASLARRLTAHVPGSGTLGPIVDRLDDFARGVDRPSRSSAIAVAAVVSAVCWLLDMTTFWLVARSLGIELSPAAALLVAAVTVLGTALPSAPGYVGTFDLAAATTAQALGVGSASAFALAVVAHVMTVVPIAVAGAVSLVAMDARLGRLAADATGADATAADATAAAATEAGAPSAEPTEP